ncbi:MAG: chorismate mutase [Acetobacterales bacterium]
MSEASLDSLRQEIDRIDDAIHDLLMARTEVVEQLAARAFKGNGVALRPGREAKVLRRLVRRHRGKFPRGVLLRIWREMFGAMNRLQANFDIGVFVDEQHRDSIKLARDHFGSFSDIRTYGSVGGVMKGVREGDISIGVVPLPQRDEVDPWWRTLSAEGARKVRIVGRLPFGRRERGDDPDLEALVVAQLEPDETGEDRSYVMFEPGEGISRDRIATLFRGAGLEPAFIATGIDSTDFDRRLHLVEVEGHIVPGDPRLDAARRTAGDAIGVITIIGGYAVPFTAEEVADPPPAGHAR